MDGNLVYTTLELVIGVLEELNFRREADPVSTYQELVIEPAGSVAKKEQLAEPPRP